MFEGRACTEIAGIPGERATRCRLLFTGCLRTRPRLVISGDVEKEVCRNTRPSHVTVFNAYDDDEHLSLLL